MNAKEGFELMSEQKKRETRLTVRLSDELFDTVNEVASDLNMSNSDMIRYALTNNLRDVSALKRKRMTIEEREMIISNYHKLEKKVNLFSSNNVKIGTNLHQLVKRLNMNPNLDKRELGIVLKNMRYYELEEYKKSCDNQVEIIRKELNNIWQLLQ